MRYSFTITSWYKKLSVLSLKHLQKLIRLILWSIIAQLRPQESSRRKYFWLTQSMRKADLIQLYKIRRINWFSPNQRTSIIIICTGGFGNTSHFLPNILPVTDNQRHKVTLYDKKCHLNTGIMYMKNMSLIPTYWKIIILNIKWLFYKTGTARAISIANECK